MLVLRLSRFVGQGKKHSQIRTFTISTNSKDLDYDKECEEDSDPNTNVDVVSPERNGDTGSRDFEG